MNVLAGVNFTCLCRHLGRDPLTARASSMNSLLLKLWRCAFSLNLVSRCKLQSRLSVAWQVRCTLMLARLGRPFALGQRRCQGHACFTTIPIIDVAALLSDADSVSFTQDTNLPVY